MTSKKITFTTENDRMRGIGTLFRSTIEWQGLGRNTFFVSDSHLQLLKDNKISFKELELYA